jgi:hypothetical protein
VLQVAISGGSAVRNDFVDAAQILGCQLHVKHSDTFFKILTAFGAGNRRIVVSRESATARRSRHPVPSADFKIP